MLSCSIVLFLYLDILQCLDLFSLALGLFFERFCLILLVSLGNELLLPLDILLALKLLQKLLVSHENAIGIH